MAPQESIRKRSGSGGTGASSAREIPDKLYFRIGEVAKLCDVPAYVLRFWEGEFPQLRPNKGGTGQRLYRRRDVEMALRIKTLLYDEGYTIPGARQAFKAELRTTRDTQLGLGDMGEPESAAPGAVDTSHLEAIRKELGELHAMLSRPAVAKSVVQPIRPPRPQPIPRAKTPPAQFPKSKLMLEREKGPTLLDSLFDDLDFDPPTQA
ncbi:MerR family transcriptional regulator [Granulicella tundricola]|uniref:Regulatory protein MerR n=1 Tax=Granulicella tundricola (strain ATCC BAA-1859 / DSM 23138 / MP5ACTX9) TaxID=1198114 RepID=E8X408_GRATM|nr:MerR family transcriptional regulator [Granulicella tundricola]ADW70516.1 regulatory protein MerR [Granulicella tundricola MP5ACTX9]